MLHLIRLVPFQMRQLGNSFTVISRRKIFRQHLDLATQAVVNERTLSLPFPHHLLSCHRRPLVVPTDLWRSLRQPGRVKACLYVHPNTNCSTTLRFRVLFSINLSEPNNKKNLKSLKLRNFKWSYPGGQHILMDVLDKSFQYFFKRCPGRGANLGSIQFSFIFSHKQHLRQLGYCAPLRVSKSLLFPKLSLPVESLSLCE